MGIIEQIQQMKTQGIPDEEIMDNLRQQGISPKEINDALNQAQIKSAVEGEDSVYAQPEQEAQNYPEQPYPNQQQTYSDSTQYGNYQSTPTGIDADSVMEISERVFEEKIKKIEKQISEFNEFRTLSQSKIENISERMKRIETILDQLQIKILEKISSYGDNLENIKNEMGMMENSFQKMVNPVLDVSNQSPSQKFESPQKKSSDNSGVNSDTIDDIFRKAVTKKK